MRRGVILVLASLAACSSGEKKTETLVSGLYYPTLHARRPPGRPADPNAFGDEPAAHSDPLPNARFDCMPFHDLFKDVPLARLRACLASANERLAPPPGQKTGVYPVARYRFLREPAPALELVIPNPSEDVEDARRHPACLDAVLPRILVPREIVYQSSAPTSGAASKSKDSAAKPAPEPMPKPSATGSPAPSAAAPPAAPRPLWDTPPVAARPPTAKPEGPVRPNYSIPVLTRPAEHAPAAEAPSCYVSRLEVEKEKFIVWETKRIALKIDFPLERIPETDAETLALLSAWAISPLWEEPGEPRVFRARVLPNSLCQRCFGPMPLLDSLDGKPPLWPDMR